MKTKVSGATAKIRDFDLEVKSVEEDGSFKGYGSVFGVVDSYQEIVDSGAFGASLAAMKAKGRKLPILWQHRSGQPLGVYTALREDKTGLYVEGHLLKEDVQQAREAYSLMKAGAVTGLSIGYYVREDGYDEKARVRHLKALELIEVSLVTFPANDEARIDAVKFAISHGDLPSLPDFERFLREAGFSKTKAAVIASHGLKHLLRSDSEGKATDAEAARAIASLAGSFSLPTF